ncbi:MAG: ABC transporter permease, partial [Vicinamibacteria bacterium]
MNRFLRFLLLVYPADARRRYGMEIVATVLERLDRDRRRRSFLFAREVSGIVLAGLRLRFAGRELVRRPRFSWTRRGGTMDPILHDLRIAARGLKRRPAFTAIAILAMALGVGANVAIFSVFHAVLLRALPFVEPERLVMLWEKNSERGWYKAQVAPANYLDWREQSRSFAGMAGYNDWLDELALLVEGEPTVVRASTVTGSFFEVLGIAPIEGRVFDEAHTWDGTELVAVLSHGLWTRQFGGDPSIVGSPLTLEGVYYHVLVVIPESFSYTFSDADICLPMSLNTEVRSE